MACTRRHAGWSSRAAWLEWMSRIGPRPQAAPVATRSHSMSPLEPRLISTLPSFSCSWLGMKTPMLRSSAWRTRGVMTASSKFGEPTSSSPSAMSTRLTGSLRPAPRIACRAARQRGLRAFLVGRAAADQDRALAGHFDEPRLPGRRAPLGGDGLFHVVHEIEGDGLFGAGVERREDRRVPLGRDALGVLEAGVERELLHQLGALLHADVLGRDRGLVDPFLEARDGFVVAALDFVVDVAELALGGGGRRVRCGPECRAGSGGVRDEIPAGDLQHYGILVHVEPAPILVKRGRSPLKVTVPF